MGSSFLRKKARLKRKKSIRKKLCGTPQRPRMSVFKSSKHIYIQIIDDASGTTLVAASSNEKAVKENSTVKNKVEMATVVGKLAGERAMEKGIKQIVFDRSGFLYHGRVKAASNGARESGLDF